MVDSSKIQWHPGFCSAVRLELRENREDLSYIDEYNLSRKPLQIDLLVMKMRKGAVIRNEIGRIFRGHNIMEYKSPEDKLNVDTYFKVLAYACLYKAGGGHVNEIKMDDISISLVRARKPIGLLKQLKEKQVAVDQVANGIYYIRDAWFAVQLIITSELDEKEHLWLRSLTEHLTAEGARQLMGGINRLERTDELSFADSVFTVALAANEGIFQDVKEGGKMNEAFRRLMEPEIKEAISAAEARASAVAREQGLEQGLEQGREQEIFSSVQEGDYDVSRGAQKLGISEKEFVARMEKAGYKIPALV